MIHSDLLNSLNDDEKVMLLACVRHETKKAYKYEDLQYIRKLFFKQVLEEYYKIVKPNQKKQYKQMVDKINPLLKSL